MALKTVRFLAFLFTALTLAPALAHVLELLNKIHLSREDYLIVQQIYRGWALLGFVIAGALWSNGILVFMLRTRRKAFLLTLIPLLCLIGAQIIFWTFTFPTNQETHKWTVLPDHWAQLRAQGEYSHAADAVLTLVAFVTLVLSVLVTDESP